MQNVRDCLKVLEAKLHWRAQELADTAKRQATLLNKEIKWDDAKSTNAARAAPTWTWGPSPNWTEQERADVMILKCRTEAFLQTYAASLLEDTVAMQQLGGYVTRMEHQFKGVYAACVRDMLQREAGFDETIGIARDLARRAVHEAQSFPPVSSWVGKHIELMETAACTQEAVLPYIQALAAATGAIAPKSSMKHLYRVLEKQALDPAGAGERSPVWDAARAMILLNYMEQFVCVLDQIQKDHADNIIKIRRVKERFSHPTSGGWSDILINLQFPGEPGQPNPNPLVWEIQLVHVHLLVVRKNLGGHESYSKYRAAREILDMHERKRSL
jgi:hypothetical protein